MGIIGTLTSAGSLQGWVSGSSALSGSLSTVTRLQGTLTSAASIKGTLAGAGSLIGILSTPDHSDTNPYVGSYEWTPSNEAQTIPISGLRATHNITINAIPENYGLITWDGATLTVS